MLAKKDHTSKTEGQVAKGLLCWGLEPYPWHVFTKRGIKAASVGKKEILLPLTLYHWSYHREEEKERRGDRSRVCRVLEAFVWGYIWKAWPNIAMQNLGWSASCYKKVLLLFSIFRLVCFPNIWWMLLVSLGWKGLFWGQLHSEFQKEWRINR